MTRTTQNRRHSVILQILLAMLLIAGMALASMGLSVYVTLSAQDDAEAINLAGSLRMQSYRIGNLLSQAAAGGVEDPESMLAFEEKEFSSKLFDSAITETVLDSNNTPLEKSYDKVLSNWREDIQPLLQAARTGEREWRDVSQAYYLQLGQKVRDIDNMVTHLQRDTEGKIELLGMTEGVSIILIIFTLIYFVMKADSNFAAPLRGLVRAAEKVEKGDLAHRIDYEGDNELGLLSHTFNSMTASLEAQYRTLEEQVAERTEELRRSNQAIYFLYKTSREIASSPYDRELLNVFLLDLKKVADVDLINLCVNAQPDYPDYDLVSSRPEALEDCIGNCSECALLPGRKAQLGQRDLSIPIRSREDDFGFLYVRPHAGEALSPWQLQLLNTVAETLSTALAFHHTLGQERRVILLEERSAIARELHDSLAQSLSYMKMETARLRKMIDRGFAEERINEALGDLQVGLNAAYKHLRELLVTFRVKLEAPNLQAALEHAVQEFDEQSPARVTLDYSLGGSALGPNEDIHIMHVLREALNNAIKHSQATEIRVRGHGTDTGEMVFSVQDDGVGLPDDPEKEHHYGLYTMRERASRLNGSLVVGRPESGGTRVELRIPVPDRDRAATRQAVSAGEELGTTTAA